MRLTSAQFRALHYIGHCHGKEAKVGSILSRSLLDWLKDTGLATEYDGIILLTQAGENEFEKLCPKRMYHFHQSTNLRQIPYIDTLLCPSVISEGKLLFQSVIGDSFRHASLAID